jgi:hypothetical protein
MDIDAVVAYLRALPEVDASKIAMREFARRDGNRYRRRGGLFIGGIVLYGWFIPMI